MRRLLLLFCLVAIGLGAAHASEIRVPKTGKYAFHVTLPKGWRTKTDTRGGMLLIPPYQERAMVYLAVLTDEKFRGQPDAAVAEDVAKIAGIETIDRQHSAQISNLNGTAFYGDIRAKRPGFVRKAKIVLVKLAPDTWAQEWVVTQAGMNPVERDTLDKAIENITLSSQ